MNRRTATWLGGTGSTLSHLDQDVRLRLWSKNNNPFGRESSQSSFLVPEDERFVGTGFIGGTPSPQQLLRQIPGRRHPQPVSELLVPGIKEPAAFFPSASAHILRHSRRIDDLQGQIEAERLEYRRLDAALRERLDLAAHKDGAVADVLEGERRDRMERQVAKAVSLLLAYEGALVRLKSEVLWANAMTAKHADLHQERNHAFDDSTALLRRAWRASLGLVEAVEEWRRLHGGRQWRLRL